MEVAILIILFIVSGLIKSANERKQRRLEQHHEAEPLGPGEAAGARPADLLGEIRKAMEQLKDQRGHDPRRQLPLPTRTPGWHDEGEDSEEGNPEERETLEIEPLIVSMETVPDRAPRIRVDQDDAAEAVATARRRWAERYARPLTAADHRAFDRRMRSEPVVAAEPARIETPERLRQLIIWNEILGKPVSLRDS